MYEETWRVIGARVNLFTDPTQDQVLIRALGWKIRTLLNVERRQWVAAVEAAVESLLVSETIISKESWHWIQVWYKESTNCPPPPPASPSLR